MHGTDWLNEQGASQLLLGWRLVRPFLCWTLLPQFRHMFASCRKMLQGVSRSWPTPNWGEFSRWHKTAKSDMFFCLVGWLFGWFLSQWYANRFRNNVVFAAPTGQKLKLMENLSYLASNSRRREGASVGTPCRRPLSSPQKVPF